MNGLSSSGFLKPTLSDIKTEMENEFKVRFGDNIDLSPSGVIGQLIAIMAEREFLIWEGQESIYYSQYWNTAEGNSLDESAQLVGLERLPALFGEGIITITGDDGTVVPRFFEVYKDGNTSQIYYTIENVTISGGTATVDVFARTSGLQTAPAGTVNSIVSNISGIDSITNAEDFFTGRNRETDADFRNRIANTLQQPGTSTAAGIQAALLQLDGVISCSVFENTSDSTDAGGRPPHSFEAFVYDEDNAEDTEIAQTILDSKPAGIQTFGTTFATVSDSQGSSYDIYFTRPVEVDVYISVVVTGNLVGSEGDLYPIEGDALVKSAVLAYGEDIREPNKDVNKMAIIKKIMEQVPGILDLDIRLGFAPSPTGTSNLSIGEGEISNFLSDNIVITS